MFPSHAAATGRARRTAGAWRGGRFRSAIALASFVLLNVLLFVRASFAAQDGDDLVGKRVVQKSRTLDLGVPPKPLTPPLARVARSPSDPPTPAERKDNKKAETVPGPALRADKTAKEYTTAAQRPDDLFGRSARRRLALAQPTRPSADIWVKSESVIPVDGAIEFFTKQVLSNPNDAFSFAMLGMLHHDREEFDAALGEYDQAIELDPKSVFARIGRAHVRRQERVRQGHRGLHRGDHARLPKRRPSQRTRFCARRTQPIRQGPRRLGQRDQD